MKYGPDNKIVGTGRRPLPTANDSEYFDGANALKRDSFVSNKYLDTLQDRRFSYSSFSRVPSVKSSSSSSTKSYVDSDSYRSPNLYVVSEPIIITTPNKVIYKKVSTERNFQKYLPYRPIRHKGAPSNEKLIKRISASERVYSRGSRRVKLEDLFLKVGLYIVLSGVVIFLNPFNWFTSSSLPSQISASHPLVVTVQPGDTLWSIAERIEPNKDPRPLVNLMASELKSPNIVAGEKIVLK